MVLYTYGQKKALGQLGHPCVRAARALDVAGHDYEIRTVKGYRLVPWQGISRGADRADVTRLSGTPEVPILVLDNATVISDSSRIVRWVRENPASSYRWSAGGACIGWSAAIARSSANSSSRTSRR